MKYYVSTAGWQHEYYRRKFESEPKFIYAEIQNFSTFSKYDIMITWSIF